MVNIVRAAVVLCIIIFFFITFQYMNKNERVIAKELNKEYLTTGEKGRAFKLKKYFFILFCFIVLEFILEAFQ